MNVSTYINVNIYPDSILRLQDIQGFSDAVAEYQAQTGAGRFEAFDYINSLHETFFGKEKYSCYQSFQKCEQRLRQCLIIEQKHNCKLPKI